MDIKAAFRPNHKMLVVNCQQLNRIPKDYYVGVKLNANDRKLIEHLYFLDMPLRQYCKKYNLNYSASLKRKKEILSKLSYILN